VSPNTELQPFERLGEAGIAALVDRLYAVMADLPEARTVWAMHPADLDEVKARLRGFLSGWLGGPDHYTAFYGEPRMRQRHRHFPIDRNARDAWMACMRIALADTIEDPALRDALEHRFATMADHLRNRVETTNDGDRMPCHCIPD